MPARECKDVLMRISGVVGDPKAQPPVRDMEISVDGSGGWRTKLTLDLDALDPAEPKKYGDALGTQIGNPTLMRALAQVRFAGDGGGCVRLRLQLDDDASAPHWVRWERIWLPDGADHRRIATDPGICFSRYIPVQQPDAEPPDTPVFRLLYAVANPEGLPPDREIQVEAEITNLLQPFADGGLNRRLHVTVAPGRTGVGDTLTKLIVDQGWQILSGPVTLQTIASQLAGGFHGLHILAHGDYNPQEEIGTLLLESERGTQQVVPGTDLDAWITPTLQLMVFQACQSAATQAEGRKPFTAVAPRLVGLGLPAAVAMQDQVAMSDASIFFAEFYRTLLDEGVVDVAVNNGRRLLINDAGDDRWSIPALFSRLKGGRLWNADPHREAVQATFDSLPDEDSNDQPLPIEAIEHTKGVASYDPLAGATGPRFDLWTKFCARTEVPSSMTILTGGRGFLKSTQLRRLFREKAAAFLRAEFDASVPVLIRACDLVKSDQSLWAGLEQVWTGQRKADVLPALKGRSFLFLIDSDEDFSGSSREDAIESLKRLRKLPNSSFCVVAEEDTLPAFANDEFADAVLLVAQQLTTAAIGSYLQSVNTAAAKSLAAQIREREYTDLACQPRFLQHLLELTQRGVPLGSKQSILKRIAYMYLARIDVTLPWTCMEDALGRVAWAIQCGRGASLDEPQLFPLLTAARNGREFGLYEFRNALMEGRNLLLRYGDEGVRFAFPPMQAYFAAQYLSRAPNRQFLLEDIAASLGRLARVRRWERVLTLLAGSDEDPGNLLRTVLAGSSLMEGEQLFLAVRCYAEAFADGRRPSGLNDVAEQMTDSLLWRSAPNGARSYNERHQAFQGLIALAVLYPRRRNDIIPYLVKVACDPVPASVGGGANGSGYDLPGIRQLAASGAARFPEISTDYIQKQRTDLVEPLQAWWKLSSDADAMKALLLRDDPRVSVIAAGALAQSGREEDWKTLLSAYDHSQDQDVRRGIVDALANAADTAWLDRFVLRPWVAKADPALNEHICFLVEKTKFASAETRAFLMRTLETACPPLQGAAMRALAGLQDEDIEKQLRSHCEEVLQHSDMALYRDALVTLRDVGDANSLLLVRRARAGCASDCSLKQLSYQVAEEMYWRLTGGLDRESYSASAFQTVKEDL